MGTMNKNDKNIIDNFLDIYENLINEKSQKKYKVIYKKPSKIKCIFNFGFCLLFMIILIPMFSFTFMYMLLFLGDLIILIYYGINLFTKRGLLLPKRVPDDEKKDNVQ